jgi:hypothetical protein
MGEPDGVLEGRLRSLAGEDRGELLVEDALDRACQRDRQERLAIG